MLWKELLSGLERLLLYSWCRLWYNLLSIMRQTILKILKKTNRGRLMNHKTNKIKLRQQFLIGLVLLGVGCLFCSSWFLLYSVSCIHRPTLIMYATYKWVIFCSDILNNFQAEKGMEGGIVHKIQRSKTTKSRYRLHDYFQVCWNRCVLVCQCLKLN